MQWSNFSGWLITGGLVIALISAIILLIEVVLGRAGTIRWPDFILLAAATLLSIVNVLVHTRDAWTSVVPTGITLSAIVTVLLLVAGMCPCSITPKAWVTRNRLRSHSAHFPSNRSCH